MKIGLISQWYEPETGSASIPSSIARSLSALGHEVTVLTGIPNYPTGEMYPGYRLLPHQREVRDSIQVHRVALYPSHDRSASRRVATFLSFAATASMAAPKCLAHCDVVLVYSTPATVGAAGVLLRKVRHIPFVLLVQDLWPDMLTASGMVPRSIEPVAWRGTERFCEWVYRAASAVAVIAPSMRELLAERGVPEHKLAVVYNWADESIFGPPRHARRQRLRGQPLQVMYAGSLGEIQGLDVAVRALADLPADQRVRLRFVGSGMAENSLRDLAQRLDVLSQVSFEGSKPISEMPELMASADVQLLCLRDLPLFRATVPSKFQAILASGHAIAVSAPGDVAELTRQSGAGLAATPEDSSALAMVFADFAASSNEELDAMRQASRRFYEKSFSAAVGSAALEGLLQQARGTGDV